MFDLALPETRIAVTTPVFEPTAGAGVVAPGAVVVVMTGNGWVVAVAPGTVVVVITGNVGVVVAAAVATGATTAAKGAVVVAGVAVVVVVSTIGANTIAAGAAGVAAAPPDEAPAHEPDEFTTGAPEVATAPRTAERTVA